NLRPTPTNQPWRPAIPRRKEGNHGWHGWARIKTIRAIRVIRGQKTPPQLNIMLSLPGVRTPPNDKVSDGSQPPRTFAFQSEPDGWHPFAELSGSAIPVSATQISPAYIYGLATTAGCAATFKS